MRGLLASCTAMSACMMVFSGFAQAQSFGGSPDLPRVNLADATPPSAPAPAAPVDCSKNPDPYKNYQCLDAYLGTDVVDRLMNYYKLEWGKAGPPSDPNAPAGRIADWPATPESTPPMPFTEWPYGGATPIGVTRPGSIDSPLMVAIANTGLGQWMNDNHFQTYGWIDPGVNFSSNSRKPGGNAPIAYAYTPNTPQLDQVVMYLDRFPDTVQTDHIDWGLRLSAIYGENYRYTTSYGLYSYQLLKHNNINGYDFPMLYGEVFIPFIFQGMTIRVGRYISVPDIEAQLAPNNYLYTHSLTYATDNYTNEGIITTTALAKNLFLQLGVTVGTEATFLHAGEKINNPDPNELYPGNKYLRDPGARPSGTACLRYTWNNGSDNIQPCANGLNTGVWGYNNLQWYGFTYYHRFNDKWHLDFEYYNEHQRGVPNNNNPVVQQILSNPSATPFSSAYIDPPDAPNTAHCKSTTKLTCTATGSGLVSYLNYSPDPLNNYSFRPEYYMDQQGQRFGNPTDYWEVSAGWQHWWSPQLETRPEVGYYRSTDTNAFNGALSKFIAPDKKYTLFAACDLIFHW
jgi:hypothetical protein